MKVCDLWVIVQLGWKNESVDAIRRRWNLNWNKRSRVNYTFSEKCQQNNILKRKEKTPLGANGVSIENKTNILGPVIQLWNGLAYAARYPCEIHIVVCNHTSKLGNKQAC